MVQPEFRVPRAAGRVRRRGGSGAPVTAAPSSRRLPTGAGGLGDTGRAAATVEDTDGDGDRNGCQEGTRMKLYALNDGQLRRPVPSHERARRLAAGLRRYESRARGAVQGARICDDTNSAAGRSEPQAGHPRSLAAGITRPATRVDYFRRPRCDPSQQRGRASSRPDYASWLQPSISAPSSLYRPSSMWRTKSFFQRTRAAFPCRSLGWTLSVIVDPSTSRPAGV